MRTLYSGPLACRINTHWNETHIRELTSERWSTCWFLIRCPSPGSWLPCSAAAELPPVACSHCHGTSLEGRGKEGGSVGETQRETQRITDM